MDSCNYIGPGDKRLFVKCPFVDLHHLTEGGKSQSPRQIETAMLR